jgi:heme-degrading monooxygenase HmoA
MFSVIFEVEPRPDQWDAYLANAARLRPELQQVAGFVDNLRYRSLTRGGWLLSLSDWRDEKAVVRWRTAAHHHEVQDTGRAEILKNYHLRVGQITTDTNIPAGYALEEQRLDETEVGEGTTIVLVNDTRPPEWSGTSNAPDCAEWLGLDPYAQDMVSWDVFEAVLAPDDLILMLVFKDEASASRFVDVAILKPGARLRQVRIVRDYGMFDRREAPQYYPEARRHVT